MAEFMYGSICLSEVPKRLFKKVKCKDGQERIFLNVKVVERKEPSQFGHTHFISCEPKEENERQDGEMYLCGDLTKYVPKSATASPEDITAAPPADDNDLPFDFRGVTA